MLRFSIFTLCLAGLVGVSPRLSADEPPREQASDTLRQAVKYFRENVAIEGGYLWRYSDDLSKREGEGKVGPTTVWVQPPGTPAVGMAFLAAFDATGDKYYLDAARDTAAALIKGQLRSGGWTYRVEFAPADRKRFAYRIDDNPRGFNVSTLDDDTTQAALRLLMRVDKALDFKDQKVHDAATFALDALLKAQYPNGAWPQGFSGPPDPDKHPLMKASYPDTWPRAPTVKEYWNFYTLNDNVLGDLVEMLLEAERTYGGGKYKAAAAKAGDFLILAQLPEPQPAWAQQYDFDMHPSWARKFEPPSVTGGESQKALLTLMVLYQATGDKKYLEPIPRALKYLEGSLLSDGRLARFYELKTNKPLYFTRQYELTFKDDDLPTHYAFKVSSGLPGIAKEFERIKALEAGELKDPPAESTPKLTAALGGKVKDIIASQDAQGRWVEEGRLRYHGPDDATKKVIDCATFVKNVETLAAYLKVKRP